MIRPTSRLPVTYSMMNVELVLCDMKFIRSVEQEMCKSNPFQRRMNSPHTERKKKKESRKNKSESEVRVSLGKHSYPRSAQTRKARGSNLPRAKRR